MPTYSTIQRALQAVDVVELEKKLAEWAKALSNSGLSVEWAGVAIDGKYLCGSANAEHEALDILNAFSHELGVVLGQRLVGDKTNESPEIIPLLEARTLTGLWVTGDALHTQRDPAQVIVEKGGPI